MNIYEEAAKNAHGWRDASVEQVAAAVAHASTHLVDVREPEEWGGELGLIEGAECISLGQVVAAARTWKKGDTHVLICRTGNRSAKAAAALHAAGFTQIVNMSGGMLAWSAAGLPRKK